MQFVQCILIPAYKQFLFFVFVLIICFYQAPLLSGREWRAGSGIRRCGFHSQFDYYGILDILFKPSSFICIMKKKPLTQLPLTLNMVMIKPETWQKFHFDPFFIFFFPNGNEIYRLMYTVPSLNFPSHCVPGNHCPLHIFKSIIPTPSMILFAASFIIASL